MCCHILDNDIFHVVYAMNESVSKGEEIILDGEYSTSTCCSQKKKRFVSCWKKIIHCSQSSKQLKMGVWEKGTRYMNFMLTLKNGYPLFKEML